MDVVRPEQLDGRPEKDSSDRIVMSTKQKTTSKQMVQTKKTVLLERWCVCKMSNASVEYTKTQATWYRFMSRWTKLGDACQVS